MDLLIFFGILFVYWLIGVFVITNDMRKDLDVSVSDFILIILIFWVCWPVAIFLQVIDLFGNKILFKRK